MTYEEAKMQIQAIPEKIWNQLSEPDREAMEMAFFSLEKQIPQKPNYYKEEDIFVKDLFFVYTYCPVCEKEIVMDDMYCGCCGQAIDWKVSDE